MRVANQSLGRLGRAALSVVLLVGVALATTDPISLLNFVAYAAVGALVVVRRPRNPIGWIVIVIAFGFITTSSTPSDVEALKAGTASTSDFLAAWVGTWAGGATFLAYAALAMIFPTGRVSAGRWRRAAIGSLTLGIVVVTLGTVTPTFTFSPDGGVTNFMVDNRFALIPPIEFESPIPGEVVFTMIPITVLAAGVVSMVIRYRRATGVERLQLRWLMAAMAFAVAAVVTGLAGFVIVGPEAGGLIWIPAIVAYPTVPLALGVAVMRYRLFEIDRIISRTIAYAGVTAVLFVVFAVVNLAIQTALRSVVTGNTVAVAVSTLVIAALFNPLRVRLQRAVDRRFNRSRYDQERTAIDFAERLRDQVDLASLRGDITGVVDATLRPSRIGVWIRRPGRGETQ